jgi:archaetidylinositol phosphate synthase
MLDTHARHLLQPLFDRSARLLLRVGLTPTAVTWIAGLIGLGSATLYLIDAPWLALFALWFSGFLDAVDGTMARISGRTSAWGTLLDITLDRIVELGIILVVAYQHPDLRWLLLLLVASIVIAMTVFLTVGALSEKRGQKSFYYQAGLAERTEGFILLSLLLIVPDWLVWTTLVFIAVECFTTLQRLFEARKLLSDE